MSRSAPQLRPYHLRQRCSQIWSTSPSFPLITRKKCRYQYAVSVTTEATPLEVDASIGASHAGFRKLLKTRRPLRRSDRHCRADLDGALATAAIYERSQRPNFTLPVKIWGLIFIIRSVIVSLRCWLMKIENFVLFNGTRTTDD